MRVTKSGWIAISMLALVSLVASSCGPQGTEVQPTAVQQEASDGGEEGEFAGSGRIDFQVFGDPAELAVFQEVAKGFNELYADAEVNVVHVPNQSDHMTKLSTGFAAGNPPDVWILNYRRYGQFAARGVIEPAGPLLEKSATLSEDMYYPQVLEAFRYRGALQCVPQNISSLVVYYNKDLFAQNNVPAPESDWTWDDFLMAAQMLTKDTNGDGVNDVHGLGVEPQLIRVAPFVWQNGGEIVDDPEKPTTLTLMEGPAREAVQFFMDLQLVYKVVPSEPEAKAESLDSRFMTGKLGMIMASRAATPEFRHIKGFEWDVAPLPQKKQKASILHSDAYCISAASKNKDLAWAFVEYAQGPEGQTVASRLGRTVPSLKSVSQSPVFLEPTEPPASSQVFLDAIDNMRQVPILSTWPKIEGVVNEELERAFYGLVPIDDALRKATNDTKALFAQGAADK